ncbi:MAG: HD domain-containing protein [Proteobacteria bacterium]|nr:HD domain-containing protein [Pseudomonadota bacterium]
MNPSVLKDFRCKSAVILGLVISVVVLLAYSMLDSKYHQQVQYLQKRTTLQLNIEQERVLSWLKQVETFGYDFVETEPLRTFVVALSNEEAMQTNKEFLENEKEYIQTVLDGFLYQNSLKRVSLITGYGDVFLHSGYSGKLNKEQKQTILRVIAKKKLEYLPVKQEGNELILEVFKPIYGFVVDDLPVAVLHIAVRLDKEFIKLLTQGLPVEDYEVINLWQKTATGSEFISYDTSSMKLLLEKTEGYDLGFRLNEAKEEFFNTVQIGKSPFYLSLIADEKSSLKEYYQYARNLKLIVLLMIICMVVVVWGLFSRLIMNKYKSDLKYQEKLEEQAEKTVLALVKTIELRDPYLAGQASEVKDLALQIATEIGFSKEDKTTIKYGAMLSGIGKIAIPKDVLTKPERLTAKELKIMKSHVSYAEEILEAIGFDFPVSEVVSQMYERLDGSGYPRNLHGTEINKMSRILAVCDVFCALCSPRSYRSGKTPQEALEIMQGDIALFDAEVLSVLYKVINKKV